jgi:hypothetical protein
VNSELAAPASCGIVEFKTHPSCIPSKLSLDFNPSPKLCPRLQVALFSLLLGEGAKKPFGRYIAHKRTLIYGASRAHEAICAYCTRNVIYGAGGELGAASCASRGWRA